MAKVIMTWRVPHYPWRVELISHLDTSWFRVIHGKTLQADHLATVEDLENELRRYAVRFDELIEEPP